MSRDVMDKVIRRLIVVYGEPKDVEPKELFAEFFKALGSYRGDILSKAADLVIRERAFPGWPTVGEVVKACREVSDAMADRHVEQPSPVYDKPPVGQQEAARLMGYAKHFMDPRRSFPALMDSARAWARHHNCKVTVDVDQDQPMIDEHGRVVPFGWRPGGSTAQVQERSHWASLQEATGLEASEIDRIMETIPNRKEAAE